MYARLIQIHGAGVDRRTRTYANERTLMLGIKRTLYSLGRGPFVVHVYDRDGRQVRTMQDG